MAKKAPNPKAHYSEYGSNPGLTGVNPASTHRRKARSHVASARKLKSNPPKGVSAWFRGTEKEYRLRAKRKSQDALHREAVGAHIANTSAFKAANRASAVSSARAARRARAIKKS